MTKKLNVSAVMNELKDQSAFFRRPTSTSSDIPGDKASNTVEGQLENKPVSAPVAAIERREMSAPTSSSRNDSENIKKPASTLASNQASLLASYHASIVETIRKL